MEEKIKVEFKKKSYGSFKIGDSVVKIKHWLSLQEVTFIVDECCSYFKELISQGQSDAIAIVYTFAKMDMLITLLATNLDLDDIDADVLGEAGVFNFIQEKVLNYNEIKSAIVIGSNMIGDGMIIEQLSNIASLDDLENAQSKISDYMNNDEYSDKVKGLIEVMLANNPKVASELEKVVSNGDDVNGGNEE
jgi:hypothetical protein